MDMMEVRRRVMLSMANGKGIDVAITQVPSKTTDLAEELFNGVNGEYGKTYVALVKSASNENMGYFVRGIAFTKASADSNPIGGAVRTNSSGSQLIGTQVTTAYDAKAAVGDVYTVYTT